MVVCDSRCRCWVLGVVGWRWLLYLVLLISVGRSVGVVALIFVVLMVLIIAQFWDLCGFVSSWFHALVICWFA